MAYQAISTILRKNDSDITASEAHGLATGLLCVVNDRDATGWLAELFPDDLLLEDEDKIGLLGLFEQTQSLLKGEDDSFRYDLFLPSEDEEIAVQLEAIRNWCEGFLFGLGYTNSTQWTGEIGEIIKDVVEFTKLDTDIPNDLDEAERDSYDSNMIEIQEYLRVATMLIKEQLLDSNQPQVES